VVVHSRGGVPVWVSPSLTDALGWDREDWLGANIDGFVHPDHLEDVQQARRLAKSAHLRLRVRTKSGSYRWVEATVRPYVDSNGRQDGGVSTFRLVDHLVAVEQALTREATTDALTGLINRRQAMSELAHRLDPVVSAPLAVAFCDLDDFKFINDTYGHLAGDHVLQVVADRAQAAVGPSDLVARIGGDEFLIVLDRVSDASAAMSVLQDICDRLKQQIDFEGLPLRSTVSVGIILAAPGDDVDQVIAGADQAMYRAKRAGRNRVVLAS
jgi:diguanylate cyclase (GGDEF)-like protein/PAS domain S-box-containing protein